MKKKTYKYLIEALFKDLEREKNKANQNAQDAKMWEDTAERNAKCYFEVDKRNRELELENQMLKKEKPLATKNKKTAGEKAQ